MRHQPLHAKARLSIHGVWEGWAAIVAQPPSYRHPDLSLSWEFQETPDDPQGFPVSAPPGKMK